MTKDHGRPESREGIRRGSREPRGKRQAGAPLVSVVIPCYNQAHFLGEAIESVLVQSHPNFEVVVIDDGSTDDTSEVAARYPGVCLVRQENQGLSGARNAGLARSEGEYVVFLDADDRLLPEALETSVGYLEARPECAFVHGHYRSITLDGLSLLEQPQAVVREDEPYAKLLYRNYISMHATVMYRRTVFETVGDFDTSLGACEDYDLYLRVARRFPVCSHENVVAEYRQHDSNMSRNPALMLSASITVLRSQWRHIRGHKQYEESYKAGIRFWQHYYGDPLVGKVRTHAREREGGCVLRGTMVLLRYYPCGLLLSERRIERRKLGWWLQNRRDALKACEQRLKELECTQEEESENVSLLAKERQEVQELKRRIQWFERRIQDLSLRARLRARIVQNSKSRRLLKRLGRVRAKLSKR